MTRDDETAIGTGIRADNDTHAARRTADMIMHMLEDFIPEHCRRDAWRLLVDRAVDNGFELTSSTMRKEYEAWKSTQLIGILPP